MCIHVNRQHTHHDDDHRHYHSDAWSFAMHNTHINERWACNMNSFALFCFVLAQRIPSQGSPCFFADALNSTKTTSEWKVFVLNAWG